MRVIPKPQPNEYDPYAIIYIKLLPDDGLILDHLQQNGEAARQFVRTNDWATVVDEFEQVLYECIESKRSPPHHARDAHDVSHPSKKQNSG